MKNDNLFMFLILLTLTVQFISCRNNVDESSYSAERFKQYAIDEGVWDRVFVFGGHDFLTDLPWDEVTEKDFERWQNYIQHVKGLIEVEKKSQEETEFALELFKQVEVEVEGLEFDERMAILREYGKKYPKKFSFWDDPID